MTVAPVVTHPSSVAGRLSVTGEVRRQKSGCVHTLEVHTGHVFGAGAALFAVARVQDVRAQVEVNVDTFGAVDDLVTDRGPGGRVVNVHIRALHLSTQGVCRGALDVLSITGHPTVSKFVTY